MIMDVEVLFREGSERRKMWRICSKKKKGRVSGTEGETPRVHLVKEIFSGSSRLRSLVNHAIGAEHTPFLCLAASSPWCPPREPDMKGFNSGEDVESRGGVS